MSLAATHRLAGAVAASVAGRGRVLMARAPMAVVVGDKCIHKQNWHLHGSLRPMWSACVLAAPGLAQREAGMAQSVRAFRNVAEAEAEEADGTCFSGMLPDLQRSGEWCRAVANASNEAEAVEAMLTPLSSADAAEAEEADSTGYFGMLRGVQCP
eukprot:CAMPEP_0183413242 /NCGR_PEP_ID=MMETSP0370-20130417/21574_1 /TAXON_ID=268820 /ORGANISM="Peridinium aciculiferum, Strain PAER-2" /LENGTH=154 /DNA_ID=CAMNT_0025596427 /DNA_START=43 /DNA_END=507 /DNA_ORIENTATION=-